MLQPVTQAACHGAVMRLVLALVAVPAIARAGSVEDPLEGPQPRLDEHAYSVGAMTGVSWDGAPSAGVVGRVAITQRLATATQVRYRDGIWIYELDAIWELTQGRIAKVGSDVAYPVKFELLVGGGMLDRQALGSLGVALRVRAWDHVTLDVSVRDEITRSALRPHPWVNVPELQMALSWTLARP